MSHLRQSRALAINPHRGAASKNTDRPLTRQTRAQTPPLSKKPTPPQGAGYLALGETLTPPQLAGAAVTLFAVYLINTRPAGGGGSGGNGGGGAGKERREKAS